MPGGSVSAGSSSSPGASSAAGRAGAVAPERRRAAFRWAERLGVPAVGGRRRCLGWCPIERDGIQRGGLRRSTQRATRHPGVIALSANGRLVRGRESLSNAALARQPPKAAAPTATSAGRGPRLPRGAVNRSLPRREELAAQAMRKSDGRSPARRAPRQVRGNSALLALMSTYNGYFFWGAGGGGAFDAAVVPGQPFAFGRTVHGSPQVFTPLLVKQALV